MVSGSKKSDINNSSAANNNNQEDETGKCIFNNTDSCLTSTKHECGWCIDTFKNISQCVKIYPCGYISEKCPNGTLLVDGSKASCIFKTGSMFSNISHGFLTGIIVGFVFFCIFITILMSIKMCYRRINPDEDKYHLVDDAVWNN
jgi:hypothetical protein